MLRNHRGKFYSMLPDFKVSDHTRASLNIIYRNGRRHCATHSHMKNTTKRGPTGMSLSPILYYSSQVDPILLGNARANNQTYWRIVIGMQDT
jgi:hypothetical protein